MEGPILGQEHLELQVSKPLDKKKFKCNILQLISWDVELPSIAL